MTAVPSLFEPTRVGDIPVANRLVMAPLTRNRAAPGNVPSALAVEYYRQRADPLNGAGLIITEGSPISPMAHGYLDTPGIHNAEQVAGWRRVTDAVHAAGGRIAIQLWHVGRISHTSLLPGGASPVSSTAVAARGKTFIRGGFADVSAPRALRTDEVAGIVREFRDAARRAMDAGFDGVEIHGANGYLVEQFLRDSINDRTDAYGGSRENRIRFLHELTSAIVDEIGGGRTGLRLSPVTPANDAALDSDPQGLFEAVLDTLAPLNLAFIHVVEGATGGPRDNAPFDWAALRRHFKGTWIANNGYGRDMAIQAVARGAADLVAFGKGFLANPDLTRRLREDAPLNVADRNTFYGGGAQGYTDYPTLDAVPAV